MCCVTRDSDGRKLFGVSANTHRNRPPGPPCLNRQPGLYLIPAIQPAGTTAPEPDPHQHPEPPPAPPGNGGGHGAGHGGHAAHNGAVGLTGVGASPGLVEGPARVLRGVDDFDRFEPGDVVVCAVTSPAWDPLLASASAVVTDTGGLAGHAAITARELGLPAVVGTGAATATITDGQLLRVDGSAGTVEVVTT